MKRLNYLIVLLVLMLIPVVAKADMGAPSFSYTVRVSNKNGAPQYETKYDSKTDDYIFTKTDKIIDYDSLLEIYGEDKYNGKIYLSGYNEKLKDDFIVSIDDVDILESDINLKSYENETIIDAVVFREGAYLYKGPSEIYGKVKDEYMIPVGTSLKIKYYDEIFGYVEYEGHKGWIYIYQYTPDLSPYNRYGFIMEKVNNTVTNMYAETDLKLYKDITKLGGQEDAILPKGTQIKPLYYYLTGGHSEAYYIEYNGEKYWLDDSYYGIKYKNKDNFKIIFFQEGTLYDSPKSENAKSLGIKIPKYTVIAPDYYSHGDYAESYYEVTYKGKTGYVYNGADSEDKGILIEDTYNIFAYEYYRYKLTKDIDIYKNPSDTTKTDTIASGSDVRIITSNNDDPENLEWIYVITKKTEGFAIYDEKAFKNNDDKPQEKKEDNNKEITIRRDRKEDNKKRKEKQIASKNKKTKTIIIASIIGASVVVLTSIVSIIFINKKRKHKAVNVDEVSKEEIRETKKKNKKVQEEVTNTENTEEITNEKIDD